MGEAGARELVLHQRMCAAEGGCDVGRGLGDDFVLVEAFVLLALAVGGGGCGGAGLEVGEEEFALFKLCALGVVFGCELGFAVL